MCHACKCGFAALALLLAFLDGASGQSGVVSGHVLGEGQAPLAGVEVQLINLGSAQVLRDGTGSDGVFHFTGVSAGRYSLSAIRDRYTAWRSDPFDVLPGIPVEVPPILMRRLQPALTNPRSGLEEMALEYGLVREQIEALPVVVGSDGRTTVDKLLHLVPGMNPARALDIDPFTGRAAGVSANGSRRSFINYKLDGALNNAQNRITGAQAANLGPVPEAMESLRVITHTYSASEGRNAGAVVAARFRSGDDFWHGQLRGYVRPPWNEALGAFDGSRDRVGGWVGGGQIGGPLNPRHKLFGFIDGEGWLTNRNHRSLRGAEHKRAGAPLLGFERVPGPPERTRIPNGKFQASSPRPVLSQRDLDTFRASRQPGRRRLQSRSLRSHATCRAGSPIHPGNRFRIPEHYLYSNREFSDGRASPVSPGPTETAARSRTMRSTP